MKNLSSLIFVVILFNSIIFSQNITNTLGSSGIFTIKDNSSTFFTLNQSDGTISLIAPSAGSQQSSIFIGSDRFLHTYYGSNTSGFNTFLGINSGNFTMGGNSSQGSYNTGVGSSSLSSLTTGLYNSAFGSDALKSNTSGYYNSAFGSDALKSNTSGYRNSAFGAFSLRVVTVGWQNSAFGYYSLSNLSSGDNNSAFGYSALSNLTTGNNNIGIGYLAQVPAASGNNQVRIGNTSITYAGVQVAWTVTSDKRWKDNIQTTSLGLDFISKLNPVAYIRKNDEKQRIEFGLIAQELEEVLKEFNIENSGMLTIDDDGYYHLRYNDLFSPIIKGIQELRIKNEELRIEYERQITMLKNENGEVKEKLAKFEQIQEMLVIEMESLKLKNNETVKLISGEFK